MRRRRAERPRLRHRATTGCLRVAVIQRSQLAEKSSRAGPTSTTSDPTTGCNPRPAGSRHNRRPPAQPRHRAQLLDSFGWALTCCPDIRRRVALYHAQSTPSAQAQDTRWTLRLLTTPSPVPHDSPNIKARSPFGKRALIQLIVICRNKQLFLRRSPAESSADPWELLQYPSLPRHWVSDPESARPVWPTSVRPDRSASSKESHTCCSLWERHRP